MKNYILLTTILMGVSKISLGAAAGGAGAEEVSKPQVQLVANGPNPLLEADKVSIDGGDIAIDGGDIAIEGDKVVINDLLIKATGSVDIRATGSVDIRATDLVVRSSGTVTLGGAVSSSKPANKS